MTDLESDSEIDVDPEKRAKLEEKRLKKVEDMYRETHDSLED